MFKILFSNNGLTAYKPLSSDLQNYIQKIMNKFTNLKHITLYDENININNASLQINKYYKNNYIFIMYFLAGYHFRYLVETLLFS